MSTTVLFVGGPLDCTRRTFETEPHSELLGIPGRYTHHTYQLPHFYEWAEVEEAETDALLRLGINSRIIDHEYRLARLENPNPPDYGKWLYFYLYAGKH